MVKIEDIVFWIFIATIIGIALWLIKGSPTEIGALIAIALFVANSEVLLWRRLFEIDKKVAVSYTRVKDDLAEIRSDIEELKNLIKK